jgi:hypothetical protein
VLIPTSDGNFGREEFEWTRLPDVPAHDVAPDVAMFGDDNGGDPVNDDISDNEGPGDFHIDGPNEEEEDIIVSEQQKSKRANREKAQKEKMLDESDLDPWECHDPHDASDVVLKPFKKGTYKRKCNLRGR